MTPLQILQLHTNFSDNLGLERVVDKFLQFQQKLTEKYCSEGKLSEALPKECCQQLRKPDVTRL